MRVELEEEAWILDEIGDVEWFMLVQLPQAADLDQSERGRGRLLPDPTDAESSPEVVADWKDFVQPEIESQFVEGVAIVAADLSRAEEVPSFGDDAKVQHRLTVPLEHSETWYSVLNQARLILNEEHEIARMERSLLSGERNPTEIDEPTWLTMVQYRVYGAIQEFLLTHLMEG